MGTYVVYALGLWSGVKMNNVPTGMNMNVSSGIYLTKTHDNSQLPFHPERERQRETLSHRAVAQAQRTNKKKYNIISG